MTTRGSVPSDQKRSDSIDGEMCMIISIMVTTMMREAIPEMFGSIKNTLIEQFDECYTVITKFVVVEATAVDAATRPHGGGMIRCSTRNSTTRSP